MPDTTILVYFVILILFLYQIPLAAALMRLVHWLAKRYPNT